VYALIEKEKSIMQKEPSFHIGKLPIYGDAIIAPMSGYTDSPFRRICRVNGSAMSYTGLISEGVVRHEEGERELKFAEEERPIAFNIIGRNEEVIEMVCRFAEEGGADIIDINMGCPSRKVVLKNQGAYLLQHPNLVASIIKRIASVLSVPVTAKIRLGWDCKSRNYLDIARIIEDNGAAMLAVHARTKDQGYTGSADWDAIGEIKKNLKIPVLGNGDIKRAEDIDRMKRHTGCDGVLIGRAAMGNPWIFSRRNREDISQMEMFENAKRHLAYMIEFYGSYGLILFRKHAVAYFKNTPGAAAVRKAMMTATTAEEFISLLSSGINHGTKSEENPK
jgi:tRNA-dihydrouridine synthase B